MSAAESPIDDEVLLNLPSAQAEAERFVGNFVSTDPTFPDPTRPPSRPTAGRYAQAAPSPDHFLQQPQFRYRDVVQTDENLRQERRYHEARIRGLEDAIKALSVRPSTPRQAPQVLVQPQPQAPPIPEPQFGPLVDSAEDALEDTSHPFFPRDRHEAVTLVKLLRHLENNEPEQAKTVALTRLQTLLLARSTDWGYALAVSRYQEAQSTGLFTLPPQPPPRPSYGLSGRVQRRSRRYIGRGRGARGAAHGAARPG